MRLWGKTLALALLLVSFSAFATMEEARTLFDQRENPEKIGPARAKIIEVINATQNFEEKVQAIEMLGRLAYYQSLTTSNDRLKKAIFGQVYTITNQIQSDRPEYFYWRTLSLALWGSSASFLEKIAKVGELEDLLKAGLAKGSTYENGGFSRLAAAIHVRASSISSLYNPEEGLRLINMAIDIDASLNYPNGPKHYNAYVVKAEILHELNKTHEAQQLLEDKKAQLEDAIEAGKLGDLTPESKLVLDSMAKMLADLDI